MYLPRVRLSAAAAALVLAASPVAAASPLDVQLVGQLLSGKGRPAVIVSAHVSARNLRLDLTRSGCGAGELHLAKARVAAGREARFELDQPVGRCDWRGTLSAVIGGEESTMPLAFSSEVAGPPRLEPAKEPLDAENHVVRVTFDRVADHARVEVVGEGGVRLGEATVPLGGQAAGELLSIPYPAGGTPLEIEVTVYDPGGLFAGLALYPWRLAIPHEEVQFRSGSAELQASEAPKLAASAARIDAELRKIAGRAPVRLFVLGYTDTVGAKADNAALSLARARSIGRWFRAHGVRLPLLVAGLGEEALAVATPDETPEARNRRAEYILSVDPPPIENAPAPPRWEELP